MRRIRSPFRRTLHRRPAQRAPDRRPRSPLASNGYRRPTATTGGTFSLDLDSLVRLRRSWFARHGGTLPFDGSALIDALGGAAGGRGYRTQWGVVRSDEGPPRRPRRRALGFVPHRCAGARRASSDADVRCFVLSGRHAHLQGSTGASSRSTRRQHLRAPPGSTILANDRARRRRPRGCCCCCDDCRAPASSAARP